METKHGRKYCETAQILFCAVGKGASYPAPAPVVEPEPVVPPAPAPEPEKTKAELELERDLADKEATSASKRTGRKSTILTRGTASASPNTASGGLLNYESMTGMAGVRDQLKVEKLGG